VEEMVTFPDELASWLGRLKLLYGCPINYLVPDEGMLPPESIRFFYLDDNWINALADGAFSIGRNLTYTEQQTPDMAQDTATQPIANSGAQSASAISRAKALGVESKVSVSFQTVSGFLLRSSVIRDYPGLGVNPYPEDGTPDHQDPKQIKLLNILRMERLGADSDTLICLVEGDIFRVDIHEAPEALHYGLDSFSADDNTVESIKKIYRFSKDSKSNPRKPLVTMEKAPIELDLGNEKSFRSKNDPRTLKMRSLSKLFGKQQQKPLPQLDAAEMGFEMVAGVGMVSFYRKK
jgi:hypothetical protein